MDKAKCIGIGLAVGLIFGVALHSYGLGILIGLAVGGLICLVRRSGHSVRRAADYALRLI